MRRSLMLAAMAVLAVPGVALAAEPGAPAGGWVGPFAVLVAGFAMAFAAGLCALGQGKAIASAVDAMARQPGAAARIQTAGSGLSELSVDQSRFPRNGDLYESADYANAPNRVDLRIEVGLANVVIR